MGIDEFDYKEPACATCGGKEFYYPETETQGAIPVERIIEKEDEFLSRNDLASAEKLLRYWLDEAKALNDKRGELVVTSELTGVFRKTGNNEDSENYCAEILRLIDETDMAETTSGATFLLNVATNKKAFGDAKGALKIYDEVNKVFSKNLDADNALFGGLYNNSALSYADLGDYDTAISYFEKALEIAKNNGNKLDEAVTYTNLSTTFLRKDPFDDENVDKALDNALSLLNDESVTRDGYYAFVCEKCASAFSDAGRFIDAQDLSARARSIYERR